MVDDFVNIHCIDKQISLVNAPPHILGALQELLSFYVKDHQHMPLFKKKIWDGKTYMFTAGKRTLPVGLIPEVETYCIKMGIAFSKDVPKLIEFDVDFFLKHVATTTDMEIMDHQLDAVQDILVNNSRLILSPTSSGKSLILYLVARYINLRYGKRFLIIVPNVGLVAQMAEDLASYANDGWTSIHQIYAEQEVFTSHDVVVSTYQSAVKLVPKFYEQFRGIAIDEAHGATSKSISTILNRCSHMDYVCGLTGTLNGTYLHEMEMKARFGQVTRVISTKELMDLGRVAKLTIDALTFVYPLDICVQAGKWDYREEIDFITKYRPRNEFIADIATTRPDGNVLVLFNLTEHGNLLKEMIQSRLTSGELFHIDGNVSVDERSRIRARLEESVGNVLLASYGTSSVGMSVKNLHWMILAHPYKDRIRVLQTIGRIIRISKTKLTALVTDIGDKLSGKRKKDNVLYEHFLKRLEYYAEEQFDFDEDEMGI